MSGLFPVVVSLLLTTLLLAGCESQEAELRASIPRPDKFETNPERRVREAVMEAIEQIVSAPESDETWGRLGMLYLVHKWHEQAAVSLRKASTLSPKTFRWHYYLGHSLAKLEPVEAAQALERAVALDEDYAAAHVYLALALRKSDRREDARQHLERAVELEPDNPHAHVYLGQVLAALKEHELARKHLQTTLRLHPDYAIAHRTLARVSMILGDRDAAVRHAKASKVDSDVPPMRDPVWGELQQLGRTARWYAARGNKYLREGNINAALEQLEIAVSNGETDPEYWLSYGTALLYTQQFQKAREALETAATEVGRRDKGKKRTAVEEKILVNLAVAATQLKDLRAALVHLETARDLNPASLEVLRNLSIVYYNLGDIPKAIQALEKSHALSPNVQTQQALRALYRAEQAAKQ